MFRTRLSIASLTLALALAACATSSDDPQSSDGGSAGAPGTGATGGGGGTAMGGGGQGGESPCGMDCSAVNAPDCYVGVCNTGEYPGTVGACTVVPVDDDTPCDDGEFCTTADTCQAGVCTGGPVNDCGMEPDACQEVVCEESTDSCGTQPVPDGGACTPEDLCVVNGVCTGGQCLGEPKDCLFAPVPDECHVAVCNPTNGECEPQPGNEGDPCTDMSDLCSVGNVCTSGTCGGGSPKDCSALNVGCQVGMCDATSGNCVGQAVPNGGACDDNDPCTTGEICTAGQCTGGTTETMCTGGDLCCPMGCDATSDSDCALTVLLMGDNVDQAGWDTYRTALMNAGKTWTEHDLASLAFPTLSELNAYNAVIWFDETVLSTSEADAQVVVDWLGGSAGNRNIFVTGVDFMWDMQNGTTGELNMYNAMGASYVGDYSGTGITVMDGVMNDPITGSFVPTGLTLAGTSDSSGDYADPAAGPGTVAGIYGAGDTGTGQSGLSHYNSGGYKLVWLGVNFHNGLTSQPQRDQLMQNIVSYFVN